MKVPGNILTSEIERGRNGGLGGELASKDFREKRGKRKRGSIRGGGNGHGDVLKR